MHTHFQVSELGFSIFLKAPKDDIFFKNTVSALNLTPRRLRPFKPRYATDKQKSPESKQPEERGLPGMILKQRLLNDHFIKTIGCDIIVK